MKSWPSKACCSRAVAAAIYLTLILVCFSLLISAAKNPEKRSLIVSDPTPARESVIDRGLVTDKVTYKSILKENGRYWSNTTVRHFRSGTVLAYVTPWNGHGYDVAKRFRSRFTHVSPVWYQVKSEGQKGLVLTGGHDADMAWVREVRGEDGSTRIVPRVVLEGWPLDAMLTNPLEKNKAIKLIADECRVRGYDGIVLEAWSAWTASRILENPDLRSKALDFVTALGDALHSELVRSLPDSCEPRNMELIFVIPPPSPEDDPRVFTATDLAGLAYAVSGFSLMTYDFSNAYRPGPNAPLPFVRACLQLLLPHVDPVFPAKDKDEEEDKEEEEELGGIWGGGSSSRELKSTAQGRSAMASRGRRRESLAGKVFMGLNFYGNDFTLPQGGGAIVGHEYLKLLDEHRPKVIWDENAEEHVFSYSIASTRHQVFFPSLKSIAVRLDEARAWGAGISIWEIGQGLDYFYDLL